MAGYDTKNINDSRISIMLAHTPAGTSVKDILHFDQVKCVFFYTNFTDVVETSKILKITP